MRVDILENMWSKHTWKYAWINTRGNTCGLSFLEMHISLQYVKVDNPGNMCGLNFRASASAELLLADLCVVLNSYMIMFTIT